MAEKMEFTGDKEFFQEIEDFRQEIYELYESERLGELSDDEQVRLNEWRVELLS